MQQRVLRHLSRAAAVVPVAGDEGALVAVVVRDDDPHGDGEPRDADEGDDQRPRRALADREVGAHERDHERDGLFARRREDEEHGGTHPAVLFHVQERPEQERRRQGDGVELVEDEEAERRIQQVRAREERPGRRVARDARAQPIGRPRAGGGDRGLADQQHHRARPDEPGEREQRQDGVDVRTEPRHLPRLEVPGGDLEEVAVRRVVHGLHHVAEVVASVHVRPVLEPREQGVDHREEDRAADHVEGAAAQQDLHALVVELLDGGEREEAAGRRGALAGAFPVRLRRLTPRPSGAGAPRRRRRGRRTPAPSPSPRGAAAAPR